jgi:ABC-type polysaccharide/polyol phosphate export permease
VIEEARALWTYRGLVVELAIRDIKVRYKRSVLGIFWTMLAPLLNMVVLTLVFSTLLQRQIANYPVYFLTGSLFWAFFAQTTSFAASQTGESNRMAGRIYVPRSVFVAAAVAVGLVNVGLSLVPLLLLLAVTGFPLYATWFFLPVSILLLLLFTSGVALLVFTLTTRFTDVRETTVVLLQLWFFLTPIIYHPSIVPPRYRLALWANPMYYLVQTFRKPIYEGQLPSGMLLAAAAATSAAVFAMGWVTFARHADRFAFES